MERKKVLIIIGVLALIAFFVWMPRLIPKNVVDKGAIKTINVEEITQHSSTIDAIGQQDTKLNTVFTSEGWYQGKHFVNFYEGEDSIKMKITPEMNPHDGIIEGFILENLEGDKVYLYIFLDGDWRQKLPNTNLNWGRNFQNQQKFDFSKTAVDGIYMNKIEDDKARFDNGYMLHYGGLYVGELKENGKSTVIKFN